MFKFLKMVKSLLCLNFFLGFFIHHWTGGRCPVGWFIAIASWCGEEGVKHQAALILDLVGLKGGVLQATIPQICTALVGNLIVLEGGVL